MMTGFNENVFDRYWLLWPDGQWPSQNSNSEANSGYSQLMTNENNDKYDVLKMTVIENDLLTPSAITYDGEWPTDLEYW